MQQIIIGYLFQYGQCNLPGIGRFQLSHTPASYDITNKVMNPPVEKISFEESSSIKSGNLIEIISLKKGVNKDTARIFLEDFCKEIRNKLDAMEPVIFDSIGTLFKGESEKIEFRSVDSLIFVTPIPAEKIHSEVANHSVLVGDTAVNAADIFKESASPETKIENRRFEWIIILACIALAIAAYHFYSTPNNKNPFGNQSKINVVDPPKTYE